MKITEISELTTLEIMEKWLVRESCDKTNQKEKTNSDHSDAELRLRGERWGTRRRGWTSV